MEAHKVIRWAWSQLIRKVLLHNVKEEQDFFDVTLARDDAQFYSHKVIRWAWSPFFWKILFHSVEEEPGLFEVTVRWWTNPSTCSYFFGPFFRNIQVNRFEEDHISKFLSVFLNVQDVGKENVEKVLEHMIHFK